MESQSCKDLNSHAVQTPTSRLNCSFRKKSVFQSHRAEVQNQIFPQESSGQISLDITSGVIILVGECGEILSARFGSWWGEQILLLILYIKIWYYYSHLPYEKTETQNLSAASSNLGIRIQHLHSFYTCSTMSPTRIFGETQEKIQEMVHLGGSVG